MNADDSARDVSHTDWVMAAMAGRGSDIAPPPGTRKQVALAIAWFIAEIAITAVIVYAADAAFWPLTQ